MESSFWSFNLGQVVLALGMLAGFTLWFSRFEGRIRSQGQSLASLTTETARALAELTLRINQIDREGTRKSQQSISADEKLNEVTLKRLDKQEEITSKLVPTVTETAVNMRWVVHHIQKNGTKDTFEKK